jgi:hypothetical protein
MRRATMRGESRCEGCGEPARLDFAHLFRRGNIIAEPWCSLPEMTAALCRTCHRGIDEAREPALLAELRLAALRRLVARFPLPSFVEPFAPAGIAFSGHVLHATAEADFVAAARAAERVLRTYVDERQLPSFAPRWR